MSAIIRQWCGVEIPQRDDGYISLTKMAKATGKLVGHYTESKQTWEYLEALSSDIGIPISALVETFKGGNGEQGTYAHPKVAIHFAQWASPLFAVQVTNWVEELMTKGSVSIKQAIPQTFAEALRAYADEVEARQLAEAKVEKLEPQAAIAEEFLTALDTKCNFTQLAHQIRPGLSAKRLLSFLREVGVLWTVSERPQPRVDFANWFHTYQAVDANGKVRPQLMPTPSGCVEIKNLWFEYHTN